MEGDNDKKDRIQVSPNEVDEPRAYYGVKYTHACVCNPERWYWWTQVQGRKGDADIENRLLNTVGEGDDGTNWENSTETYITIGKRVWHGELNGVLCDNLEGWTG